MVIQASGTIKYGQYGINQMKRTQQNKQKEQEKLSSGKKINSAADDAASMAISQELIRQIKSYTQGSNNIQMGIDLTRVADGAAQSISENLLDMETDTIRGLNGTMSASDKAVIQDNINATKATIDQVADTTNYNGKKLLNGTSKNINIYTGTSSEMLSGGDVSIASLGLQDFSLTIGNTQTDALDSAMEQVAGTRSKLGAQQNGLEAAQRSNQIAVENTTSAESRLTDTDMGEAISEYKKNAAVNNVQDSMMKKQMEQEKAATEKLLNL